MGKRTWGEEQEKNEQWAMPHVSNLLYRNHEVNGAGVLGVTDQRIAAFGHT